MPQSFTLNPGGNTTFTNPLHKIEVTAGSLTVHQGVTPTTVEAGEVFDGRGLAPHDVYSPDGANYAVTYSGEALPTPTVASEPVKGAVNAKRKTAATKKPAPKRKTK